MSNNNYFHFYIVTSLILSSLNSILAYVIIRDFNMVVNLKKINNNFIRNSI